MHKDSENSFPWHSHCKVKLLIDGQQFYPAIFNAIAQAQRYIFIEMYLVESGKVADAFIAHLTAKSRKGVIVKLIFDDFGSHRLKAADRHKLAQAGIELCFYNPVRLSRWKRNLQRTHRKIIVIDGQYAFTGGAGISDSFVGVQAWRETMLQIQGSVVMDWQQLFVDNFLQLSSSSLSFITNIAQTDDPTATSSTSRARVVYSNGGTRIALKRSLIKHIKNSQHTVWLSTAYFIPTRKIRRALQRAARQGKDVRLLLPGEITDHPAIVSASRRYYARLLRHDVRIFEYEKRFMHAKVILVDNWSSIGSSNMDRWNLLWNLEANQEIIDPEFSADVKKMLLNDFAHSKEITYSAWRQRSSWQRLKERFWGSIDLWLTQWRKDE